MNLMYKDLISEYQQHQNTTIDVEIKFYSDFINILFVEKGEE